MLSVRIASVTLVNLLVWHKKNYSRFCLDFLPPQDYPSLPGPPVAPAGSQDQGSGPRPEGAEGSPALPHAVRLCNLPQPAGVTALQPKDIWIQFR